MTASRYKGIERHLLHQVYTVVLSTVLVLMKLGRESGVDFDAVSWPPASGLGFDRVATNWLVTNDIH